MAQEVEHVLGKDEVTGSNPVSSSSVGTRRLFKPFAIGEGLILLLRKTFYGIRRGPRIARAAPHSF